MELKLEILSSTAEHTNLLIVPYGIETKFLIGNMQVDALLIVPYGIETFSPAVEFSALKDF